jgi:hypothetical protein
MATGESAVGPERSARADFTWTRAETSRCSRRIRLSGCHELVPGIHHVGIAVRADLDLGDGLQDSAEAHLRRGQLEGVLAEGTASVTYGSDSFLK